MLIKEHAKLDPMGFVQIVATDVRTNESKILVNDHNLVVTNFRPVLRDMLFGDENKSPTIIKIGDCNKTPTDDLMSIDPPLMGDLDIINMVFTSSIITKTKLNENSKYGINYNLVVASHEANGTGNQIMTEIGLFTTDGNLIARKTFPAIIKNVNIALSFNWKILF